MPNSTNRRVLTGGSAWRYTALLSALGAMVTGVFAMTAERGPVVIVDARVIWTEPALADGGAVFGLEVEDVVHGHATGSVLVAREAEKPEEDQPQLGAFLAARLEQRLRVELRAREDGLFDLVSAQDIAEDRQPSAPTNVPGGIAIEPGDREDSPRSPRVSIPRRVRSAAEDDTFEQQLVELVNEQRWTYDEHPPAGPDHLPPLKRVEQLNTSADLHSFNMADRDFFAHCDPDTGKSPFQRMLDAGYVFSAAGENITVSHDTPAGAMASWMDSPLHRANIMDMDDGVNDLDNFGFREIGTGFHFQAGDGDDVRRDLDGDCVPDSLDNGPYGEYWTQNFGRRNSVYPVVIEREASSTSDQTVTLYVYGAGFATHMRFSNTGPSSGFSDWEPYSTSKTWTLTAAAGDKTVWAQLDGNGNGTPDHTASDTIYFDGSCTTTTLEDMDLDGSPDTYEDCHIVAGPGVAVTANTWLLADTVALRSGFSVELGSDLHIGPRS